MPTVLLTGCSTGFGLEIEFEQAGRKRVIDSFVTPA